MAQADVEQRAHDLFESGFHCAESMSAAIVERYAGQAGSEVTRVAAGFMGGMGGTHREACGALTGGVIAVGYLLGRTEPGEDTEEVKALAAEFRSRFIDKFGSATCGTLLGGFGPQEECSECKKLTAAAAGLLSELLDERGLTRNEGACACAPGDGRDAT